MSVAGGQCYAQNRRWKAQQAGRLHERRAGKTRTRSNEAARSVANAARRPRMPVMANVRLSNEESPETRRLRRARGKARKGVCVREGVEGCWRTNESWRRYHVTRGGARCCRAWKSPGAFLLPQRQRESVCCHRRVHGSSARLGGPQSAVILGMLGQGGDRSRPTEAVRCGANRQHGIDGACGASSESDRNHR